MFHSGCNTGLSDRYSPPELMNDGLQVGTLAEAGMDPDPVLKAACLIEDGKFKQVHSMLIYRNDKLVYEEYFPGFDYQWDAPYYRGEYVLWNRDRKHNIMSCSKSIVSACFCIAIEEGFIKDVHQSIFDYLPDHQQYKTGGKENITIEHLLTMTSGLQWNEWNAPHGTAANDIDRLYFECADDPVACVLERPLVSEPGQSFTYNGGGIITLGEILRNATGMSIVEFAAKYLFDHLGIDSTYWAEFPNGIVEAAGGLQMTPRSMLKLGVCYLNGGKWNGKQVVTADWVARSSRDYNNNSGIRLPIEDSGKNGYGYTWWTSTVGRGRHKTHMYRANGWGGQVIMVLPELEMVVVFTGGNYTQRSKLFKILEKYILPATW